MVRIKRWIRVLAVLAVLAVGLGLAAAGALYWLVAPRLPDRQRDVADLDRVAPRLTDQCDELAIAGVDAQRDLQLDMLEQLDVG